MPLLPRPTDPAATARTVRGPRRRRVTAVAGTGFMLAVSALALAACGSDPSGAKSDPPPTTSTAVKKQAGATHTELVVTNGSGIPLPVKVCTHTQWATCSFTELAPGGIAKDHDDGDVEAAIKYPDGSITYIEAGYSWGGGAVIRLSSDYDGRDNSTGQLDPGKGGTYKVRDHVYYLSRDEQDYIEQRVLIK